MKRRFSRVNSVAVICSVESVFGRAPGAAFTLEKVGRRGGPPVPASAALDADRRRHRGVMAADGEPALSQFEDQLGIVFSHGLQS